VARLARAYHWTTAEVRAAPYRDIRAMAEVLQEEELARKRAQGVAGMKRGRR
jgi:hypothetical protein